MNSTELFLCTVCAVSFASTLLLLLLSLAQRITPSMKARLLQMAFSFTRVFTAVFALAQI